MNGDYAMTQYTSLFEPEDNTLENREKGGKELAVFLTSGELNFLYTPSFEYDDITLKQVFTYWFLCIWSYIFDILKRC